MRWAISDTFVIVGRGIQHWIREPLGVLAGMAFMIMLVVLYGFLFGGAMSVPGGGNYLEFLMPGMFVMTMAFGIGETMAYIAADAERGVTDRFRSMPMAASAVLLGRSITDMIYATVGLAVMIGCGLVLGWRWHGSMSETAAAIGLLLLLRFAMLWVGIYLGLLVPGPAAVNSVWTLLFPFTMVTVAFAASQTMPAWLGFVAEANPLSATIYATRDLFGNPGADGTSFVAQNARAAGGRLAGADRRGLRAAGRAPIPPPQPLSGYARPSVAGSSIGRSRCAPSAATRLTSVLTGHIRSDSTGAGASIGSSSASEADGSSQASSRSGGRMTGMRLWIGATSAFGWVVRMAAVTPSVAAAAPDAGQRQHLAVGRRTDRVRLTGPRRRSHS